MAGDPLAHLQLDRPVFANSPLRRQGGSGPMYNQKMSATGVFRQLEAKSFTSCWRVIKELRCVHVLDPIPTKRSCVLSFLRSFRTVHFSSASIASSYHDQCARARNIFILRCGTKDHVLLAAAEPPADQFGTLALPAHSQRESRRLGGRHRPAPGFPDHWAGSRTETI